MLRLWSGFVCSLVLASTAIAWFAPQTPVARDPKVVNAAGQEKAVRQAVIEYAESVYSHDVRRLQAVVHPSFVRTSYVSHQQAYLETRMQLADALRWVSEYNKDQPVPAATQKDVTILDALDQTATAKLIAQWGIESLHLSKVSGKWMVVHALAQTPLAPAPN